MRRKGKAALLFSAILTMTVGCQFMSGFFSASAGPYEVEVVDAATGGGIAEALVGWDYYFSSKTLDPAQRPNMGVCETDLKGVAIIPEVVHPGGDRFEELNVDVTAAGYLEAKRKVTAGGGKIRFELTPVEYAHPYSR